MQLVLLVLSIAPVLLFAHMIYKRDFDSSEEGLFTNAAWSSSKCS